MIYKNRSDVAQDESKSQNIKSKLADLRGSILEGYVARIDDEGKVIAPGWSVFPGDRIGLALSGSYDGRKPRRINFKDAARKVAFHGKAPELRVQSYEGNKPWASGVNFEISGEYVIPDDLQSGVYFAANDWTLFFVVKPKPDPKPENGKKRIGVLISTNTFNAYSTTLGRSLYLHPIKVPEVSFFRPQNKVKHREWVPFVRWLLEDRPFGRGVQFEYFTDFDMERSETLNGLDLVIVLGHSEYWTRKARRVFDQFVDNGGHALIASGNTMWWQAVYGGEDESSLISYKNNRAIDPLAGTKLETTYWNRKRLDYPIYPSIGAAFDLGGYGKFRRPKQARGWAGYRIIDGSHPLLKKTGLRTGDCIPFYRLKEYDGAPIVGFDKSGNPVPDLQKIGAHRFELIGFDLGYRSGHTVGTMLVMRKTPESGLLFNLAAKDFGLTWQRKKKEPWKSSTRAMQQIFKNFVTSALAGRDVFSDRSDAAENQEVAFPMTTPWDQPLPSGLPFLKDPPDCGHPPKEKAPPKRS